MKRNVLLLIGFLLTGLLAIACTPVPVNMGALRTEAAATVFAELTAQLEAVTETVSPVTPTLTAAAVSALIPTATSVLLPTPTLTTPSDAPTMTPGTPTLTSEPMPTPAATLCLPGASFVEDVTVPDGTNFSPSETFTKTWRLFSDGCVPWPSGTLFVFDSGDQMGAPDSAPVPDTPIGDTVDISVEMIAPDAPGTYRGYWQMQGPDGDRWGSRVYVEIVVPEPTPMP